MEISELLKVWDTAHVNLNRNGGFFKSDNVRLRNCSLDYNNGNNSYFVKYKDVSFGLWDIEIVYNGKD